MRDCEQAHADLGYIEDRLHEAVASAIAESRKPEHSGLTAFLGKRSQASIRNDLIWQELKREFTEPEVNFTRDGNILRMVIGDYSIRVKMLNRWFRPMNNWTQRSLDFVHQRSEQPPLPGFDPPTNIDLSYMLTGFAGTTLSVYLRCPHDDKSPAWAWELLGTTAGAAVPLDDAQVVAPSAPMVRPKVPAAGVPEEGTGAEKAV